MANAEGTDYVGRVMYGPEVGKQEFYEDQFKQSQRELKELKERYEALREVMIDFLIERKK